MADRMGVITGADSGIGLAMTRALLDMGDRVAALVLSGDNLNARTSDDWKLRF
jgi:NAD(P)-dependent dehydrogenase (short-subunit alcohol dehydrogenase family)